MMRQEKTVDEFILKPDDPVVVSRNFIARLVGPLDEIIYSWCWSIV